MLEPDAEADRPIHLFCTGFEEVVFRKLSFLHFVREKPFKDLRGVEL